MKCIITILILFVTLDCFSQSTQTFFKDSFAIFPQTRPITRLHVQGNAFITDSLRLTGLPVGSGSDSILSITTSGVVRKTVNGGGGTNTDNWDSVLIRQGSNVITQDHTVNFNEHNLTLTNGIFEFRDSFLTTAHFSVGQSEVAAQGGVGFTGLILNSNEIDGYNFGLASSGHTGTATVRITADADSGKITYSASQNHVFDGKVVLLHPDTLLTTPEFVYVSDNDTIKKYPFSGGGGSSLFPIAGGSTTLDADVAADISNKKLQIFNSSNALLDLRTDAGEEHSYFQSYSSESNTVSGLRFKTNSDEGYTTTLFSDNGVNQLLIVENADDNSLTYTAATHTFNGNTIFPNNGTPDVGKVPTGTDNLGNWTWQAAGGGGGWGTTGTVATLTGNGTLDLASHNFSFFDDDGGANGVIINNSSGRAITMGAFISTNSYGGIWFGDVTPSTSNYNIVSNNVDMYLNASAHVYSAIGGAIRTTTTSSGFGVDGNLLVNAGSVQFSGYGAGTATFDASGNISSVSAPAIKYAHTIFTPTTGGTVSLTNNRYNIINPAGALLALTVNLPSSPANNDVVYIKFTQTISTVTYANGTVVDGITAPTAGGLTVLTYDSGTTSWY